MHISRKQSNLSDFTAVFPETATIWVLQKEGTHLKFTLFKNPPTSKAASRVINHMDYFKNQLTYENTPLFSSRRASLMKVVKSRLQHCPSHTDCDKTQLSCNTGGERLQNHPAKPKVYRHKNQEAAIPVVPRLFSWRLPLQTLKKRSPAPCTAQATPRAGPGRPQPPPAELQAAFGPPPAP